MGVVSAGFERFARSYRYHNSAAIPGQSAQSSERYAPRPFTGVSANAVIGPAFMPGTPIRRAPIGKPRSRGFSLFWLEPNIRVDAPFAAKRLKPRGEKTRKRAS